VRLFGGQLEKDGLAYIAYANDRVTERLEAESSPDHKPRHDLMHHLIHARDPQTNAPFTRRDLDAESSLLIAAGADTTSTTLAAALFYLTLPSSQAILSDLTTQLSSQFPTVESIRGQAITNQPLLRAIIDESLRLSPSVPTHLPRTIVQNPGITIAGHFIPKGTTVGCAAYVLHRDPLAFPKADEFLPERWLVDEDAEEGSLRCKEQVDKAREAFCAFSLGSRGCVGKGLAYLELAMVLGRVLWEFDVVMVEGQKEMTVRTVEEGRKRGWKVSGKEFQLKDSFLAERDGPVVKFVKRR
jgi:cytochrome P450